MSKKMKIRILVAHLIGAIGYKPNDVVNIDQTKVKALEKDGVADSTPAAVAYAMSLGKEVLDHPDDVGPAPNPQLDPPLPPGPQTPPVDS
jgi:hypothetical protein